MMGSYLSATILACTMKGHVHCVYMRCAVSLHCMFVFECCVYVCVVVSLSKGTFGIPPSPASIAHSLLNEEYRYIDVDVFILAASWVPVQLQSSAVFFCHSACLLYQHYLH